MSFSVCGCAAACTCVAAVGGCLARFLAEEFGCAKSDGEESPTVQDIEKMMYGSPGEGSESESPIAVSDSEMATAANTADPSSVVVVRSSVSPDPSPAPARRVAPSPTSPSPVALEGSDSQTTIILGEHLLSQEEATGVQGPP